MHLNDRHRRPESGPYASDIQLLPVRNLDPGQQPISRKPLITVGSLEYPEVGPRSRKGYLPEVHSTLSWPLPTFCSPCRRSCLLVSTGFVRTFFPSRADFVSGSLRSLRLTTRRETAFRLRISYRQRSKTWSDDLPNHIRGCSW
jgi:hypothetical protein